MELKFTIKAVAQMSGLSAHTIRAWEKRYQVLTPARSESNRRLYDSTDVERLKLLRQAVQSGHSIGQVANLPDSTLLSLGAESAKRSAPAAIVHQDRSPSEFLASCENALEQMDQEILEEALARGSANLGANGLIEGVILPLVKLLDSRWADGTVSISQEHLASAALRAYLERVRSGLRASRQAPRLLVTTPKNQIHEIGALIVAAVSALEGWHVTYLGSNMPSDEIAKAAKKCSADAVGLSLVFPLDDQEIPTELRNLRRQLGPEVPILIGGRGAASYLASIEEINGLNIQTLADLRQILARICPTVD